MAASDSADSTRIAGVRVFVCVCVCLRVCVCVTTCVLAAQQYHRHGLTSRSTLNQCSCKLPCSCKQKAHEERVIAGLSSFDNAACVTDPYELCPVRSEKHTVFPCAPAAVLPKTDAFPCGAAAEPGPGVPLHRAPGDRVRGDGRRKASPGLSEVGNRPPPHPPAARLVRPPAPALSLPHTSSSALSSLASPAPFCLSAGCTRLRGSFLARIASLIFISFRTVRLLTRLLTRWPPAQLRGVLRRDRSLPEVRERNTAFPCASAAVLPEADAFACGAAGSMPVLHGHGGQRKLRVLPQVSFTAIHCLSLYFHHLSLCRALRLSPSWNQSSIATPATLLSPLLRLMSSPLFG